MFLVTPDQWNLPANTRLRKRLASVVGVPEDYVEATQILQYNKGERYLPHMDAFRAENKQTLARGGQRLASAITWLNNLEEDGREGGATWFPMGNPPFNVTPRMGDTVIFYTLMEDFVSVDPCSMHSGTAPLGNTPKYVAVLWFHPRRFA